MRAFTALIFVAVATAELAPLFENSEPIPGKYIIKLKDEFDVDEIAATFRLLGGKVGNIFRYALNGFAAELTEDMLDVVRRLPAVEYVEQDGVYRTQVTWGLDRIDQRSLPLDSYYGPSGTGSGYTVWVIDTGVDATHYEFGGRAQQVVNFAGGPNEDCNGHGTFITGIIGSSTYGVAKNVSIMGVKVLTCAGSGSYSGVISGVNYVRANAGSRSVATLCSIATGISVALDTAVDNLISSGVPTVVSSGNSNTDACFYSPARVSAAITVGATDSSDSRSSFSNYGSCVDILAPGTSITSLSHTSDSATKTMSGSSMSCAHVAGALVLYGSNTAYMLSSASANKISNLASGTPNLLVYV